MLFESYRFDNLDTDESIVVDGWSYLGAAVGGPLYLLVKGFIKEAAIMVVVSSTLAVAAVGSLVVVVGFFDVLTASVVATAALSLMAVGAQSIIAVQLERAALISRGWREGY